MDGNEIVDSLAKNATIDGQIIDFPLAHTDVWASTHLLQHNSTVGKWLEVSETTNVGRYYYENFFNPDKINKPWFFKLNLDRGFIVTISRLRANHYSTAASLARKNFIESD